MACLGVRLLVFDKNQLARFVAKFNRWNDLDIADVDAFLDLPWQIYTFRRGDHIKPRSKQSTCSTVIVEGIAACYLTFPQGEGQITSLHLPGDFACTRDTFLDYDAINLVAITNATAVMVPEIALLQLAKKRPGIGVALLRQSLVDANVARKWLFNMTQLSALQRVAHFLCEIVVRQEESGISTDPKCPLPLSQAQMSDILGMTTVHVNRMLRELRLMNLVQVGRAVMRIYDWNGLRNVCCYDPKYLGRPPSSALATAST